MIQGMNLNFTKDKAKKFAEKKEYEKLTTFQKVQTQLFTSKLFMPFDVFHEAVEEYFNRDVYTHEFADVKSLQEEFIEIANKKE